MTGPRTSLTHPQHRRGRRLLPLAAAMILGQLGCSTDQPTEPTAPIKTVTSSVRHPMPKPAAGRVGMATGSSAPKAAFSLGTAFSSTGPSVLVLADSDLVSTTALTTSLADAGLLVTVRPAPEYTWDGTNPALAGFDAVVHLNGTTYDWPLPASAQTALTDFVQNGGGYVTARWDGYEVQPGLAELALQEMGDYSGPEQNCARCQITYQAIPAAAGHPVLEGLPASFTFTADAHDAGPQVVFASNPSTALMQVSSGRPAVLVREFGAGRVVNFSIAPNYYWDDLGNAVDPVTLQDPIVQQLYLNAVRWAAGSASGTAQPQSITFGPLADKVYGDANFSISATASSNLPVSFITSGGCTVLGSTVSITAAGACTITAQQAGNDDYEPAQDVSQSFNIAKAASVISWSPASLASGTPLGPSQLNATASGLGGTPLAGSFVYTPPAGTSFAAGTYSLSVHFTPSDLNYAAADHSVSITVSGTMNFTGFFAPIRNLPYVNTVVAGTAIPVKFSLGSYRGLGVLQAGSPTSVPAECSASAPRNVVRPGIASTTGLKSLGYSYTYVWKTQASWGGTCRRFLLTLADGSTHEALFQFTAPRGTTATTARRIIGR
jgi:hypothetical protein